MQLNNLTRWLQSVSNLPLQWTLRKTLKPVYDRMSSAALSSAGLAISTTKTLVKTGASASYYIANGAVVTIADAVDMPALSGTVTADQFGVFAFFVDSAGTVTSAFGGSYASLALMKFPQLPVGNALIGFILVNPTGTGDFIGGTTELDDATVVPGTVYFNASAIGAGFDPWCLVGGQPSNV